MTDIVRKADLFFVLGDDPLHDALEHVLEGGGLSHPDKAIAQSKVDAMHALLAKRFVAVCSRGDCRGDVLAAADDRAVMPASSPDECTICGGSANAREIDLVIAALNAAGVRCLCVVGGTPKGAHGVQSAGGWALQTAPRGRGPRAHREAGERRPCVGRPGGHLGRDRPRSQGVATLPGPKLIQLARCEIQELARQVSRLFAGGVRVKTAESERMT